jgi:hypothetical protein
VGVKFRWLQSPDFFLDLRNHVGLLSVGSVFLMQRGERAQARELAATTTPSMVTA